VFKHNEAKVHVQLIYIFGFIVHVNSMNVRKISRNRNLLIAPIELGFITVIG